MSDSYQDDPDVILMLKVSKGDRAAFEQLVVKHQKRVLNAIYRYTGNPSVSEELAQDVFVRVYRAAPRYKPNARFSTWLFTIVRNVCVNHNTRQGKHDRHTDSIEADSLVVAENSEESLIRRERDLKVQQAIAEMPESLRLPLILHQFQYLSYEEVAEVLQLSLSAVKVRIYRARQFLLERLKDYIGSGHG